MPETRHLRTITVADDDQFNAACQTAYDLVREVVGSEDIRPVEADHRTPEGMEYRVWAHDEKGELRVYVAIVRTTQTAHDPEPESTALDFDEIVRIVRDEYGVEAFVDQTGGGTATIYAGPSRPHEEADGTPATAGWLRYAVIAGPGSYGWGQRPSTGDLEEFYVGLDSDDGDLAFEPLQYGARTNGDVARLIVAQATLPIGEVLDQEAMTVLGFDGSGTAVPEAIRERRELADVWVRAHNAKNRELIAEGPPWTNRKPVCEAAGDAAVEAYLAARG